MIKLLIFLTFLFGILGAASALLLGGVRFTKSQRKKYTFLKSFDGKQFILLTITIVSLLISYGANALKEYLNFVSTSENYSQEYKQDLYKNSTNAVIIGESNILDSYFLNNDLNFQVNIENQSEGIWENIYLSFYATFFVGSTPLIDTKTVNPLQKISAESYGFLRNNSNIEIDLTEILKLHFNSIKSAFKKRNENFPDPVEMAFNPYKMLKKYTKLELVVKSEGINDRNLSVIKQALSFPNNLKPYLVLSPEKNRFAGFLIVMFLQAETNDEKMGKVKFIHIIPFLNMWVTDNRDVEYLSDVFFVNDSPDLEKGLMIIKNDTLSAQSTTSQVLYKIQQTSLIDSMLRKSHGKLEPYMLDVTDQRYGTMELHTFVLYGSKGKSYLPIEIRPNPNTGFKLKAPF